MHYELGHPNTVDGAVRVIGSTIDRNQLSDLEELPSREPGDYYMIEVLGQRP